MRGKWQGMRKREREDREKGAKSKCEALLETNLIKGKYQKKRKSFY